MAAFSPLASLVEVGAASVLWLGKLTLVQAPLVPETGTNPSWFEHGREFVGSPNTEKPRDSGHQEREQMLSAE